VALAGGADRLAVGVDEDVGRRVEDDRVGGRAACSWLTTTSASGAPLRASASR
jgi:hypothetical protein